MSPFVNIVIPTHNRSSLIGRAIDAALEQSHPNKIVTVIDDGSDDDTVAVLDRYQREPQFQSVVLAHNVGTAQAKNVAIALNDCSYITFHDSDDIPHPDKIARQVAVASQTDIQADSILNWSLNNTTPESNLTIDLVVSEHELVLGNGERHHMRRALSLVDDVFPNLQMAAGVPGDWILINCGLFSASVFERLGGFRDSIEEDRELRNRLLFSGGILWLLPEILLTKYEYDDSLTVCGATNYTSVRRSQDRSRIWRIAEQFRQGTLPEPVPIDLHNVSLASISRPMTLSGALHCQKSASHLMRQLKASNTSSESLACIA